MKQLLFKKIFHVCLPFLFASMAWAELPVEATPETSSALESESASSLTLAQFHLGPVMASKEGSSSTSLMLRYLPEFSFGDISLGADIGLTSFENTEESAFLVSEIGLQGVYRFDSKWSIRLLSGMQFWAGNNEDVIFVGATTQYQFLSKNFKWLNGVYVSYTPVFRATLVHLTSCGISLKF